MNLSKKISVTLIFIFALLGVAYLFTMLTNPTNNGFRHLSWSIVTGIGFAYFLGYKTEITLSKKKAKK